MDEEKQQLIKQQQVGDALRELQNHQGWNELVNILTELYSKNLAILIEKDDIQARAMLLTLEYLAGQICLKIDYAKVANEDLKSERFKLMLATP